MGGQLGNVGKTLQMVTSPDSVVKYHLEICPSCQRNLGESDVIKVGSSHQVFDLPVEKLLITEHQLLVSKCNCGCQSKAFLPTYLSNSPVQYGPNIKALSVYLNTDFKIPFHKISNLFGDLYDYESLQSILPNFKNYLMHDCWRPPLRASYFGLSDAKHLICNAHLIRELQALIEKNSQWACVCKNIS